jgi:hypothetical protein
MTVARVAAIFGFAFEGPIGRWLLEPTAKRSRESELGQRSSTIQAQRIP